MARRGISRDEQIKTLNARLEFANLTDEEKESIREMAREQVAKERVAQEKERFMEVALREAKAEYDPSLVSEDVLIDLPGHAAYILVDGVQFLHGLVYEVPQPVARTLNEIVQRAWNHEREIGHANRGFYSQPRPQDRTLSQRGVTSRAQVRA